MAIACLLQMSKEEFYAYKLRRKQENKPNYYLQSLKEIEEIKKTYTDRKPKLLLHTCCAVCAGWPLEFLSSVFDITIYYNNSNIYPLSEYNRRKDELIRLVHEIYGEEIQMIFPPYDNASYTKKLEPLKDEPEGYLRCFYCYALRMREAYEYANDNHFNYFTTVMTISRQKDSLKLNEIGHSLEKKFPSVKYFYSDFKKSGGQVRRDEIVHEYNLYSQDYCGCIYSYNERKKRD